MNESESMYGEQTRLALRNFPSGCRRLTDIPEFVRAYALVKLACVRANMEMRIVDERMGEAIAEAARSVAELRHLDAFPLPLIQGGGGTSTNMNVNEVVATLANAILERDGNGEPPVVIHPNDHVNASQSTNDTYPTAMALALIELAEPALAALDRLRDALLEQARKGEGVRRLGRTCLRDAVSLTVEETHRAQATMVGRSRDLLHDTVGRLRIVPLGGTVLGTGVGAPEGFAPVAIRWLRTLTGQELEPPEDTFAAMAHPDGLVSMASACQHTAITLARIAADLRWLSAGPMGGPAEVLLPPLQAGSSIMPGKVNPVIPELVMQLSYRVRANAHGVEIAMAAGELELNVMAPVILDALVSSLRDIQDAAHYFAEKCIDGLRWNLPKLEHLLTATLDEFVDPVSSGGYTAAARMVHARSGNLPESASSQSIE